MAIFNLIPTKVGIQLLRDISVSGKKLNAGVFVTSSTSVSDLENLTDIPNIIQSVVYSIF